MTVLVAYGSSNGSTAEIADWIGDELRSGGLAVEVRPAQEVMDLDGYEAVILGGAVYAAGWHNEARRFAHRFPGAGESRPVWLFSSGPLDDSASHEELPPGPQAKMALRALAGRGHATFGGRLSDDAHGWLGRLARKMATEGHGGDFRDPDRVRAWARQIAGDIARPASRSGG